VRFRSIARSLALSAALALTYSIVGSSVPAWADTEHSNLYVLGLFASGSHRITTATDPYAFALDPSWSPSGRYIAFSYGVCDDCPGSIVAIDQKGGHRREFADAVGSRPAWSPDGRSIAFVTTGQSIASIDTTNGRTSQLLPAGRHPLDYPAWSPDGSRLAFARQVSPKNWDIFVYARSTGRVTPLVTGARSDIEPVWSRDGSWIAYVSQGADLRFAIWAIRPNGTGAHRITHGPGSAENPSWSPDGRSLSYVSVLPGKPEALWVVSKTGRLARKLTRPVLTVTSAAWAPQGDKIVFSARDTADSG
jgi:Tol biopolymer transport system component